MTDFVFGVDVGGTSTKVGLVDREGTVHGENRISTAGHADPADFVAALAETFEAARAAAGDPKVLGIGIGAPNANPFRGTIEQAPNLPWKGTVELCRMVTEAIGVPSFLTNDANAAALGEKIYGGGKGMTNLMVVTLGTGVGSGFVVGDQLMHGHTGFAGELGHVTVAPKGVAPGRVCGCGRIDCLETYSSVTGHVRTAQELLARGLESSLQGQDVHGEAIHQAALNGDALALECYRITGTILGRALANTVAITSPEAVFLFGGLAGSGDLILDPTLAALEASMLPIFRGVRLEISQLQDRNAAILGSGALAFHQLEQGA